MREPPTNPEIAFENGFRFEMCGFHGDTVVMLRFRYPSCLVVLVLELSQPLRAARFQAAIAMRIVTPTAHRAAMAFQTVKADLLQTWGIWVKSA